jgi:hypothetical protein
LAIFISNFFGFESNLRKIGLPATYVTVTAVPKFVDPEINPKRSLKTSVLGLYSQKLGLYIRAVEGIFAKKTE